MAHQMESRGTDDRQGEEEAQCEEEGNAVHGVTRKIFSADSVARSQITWQR